MTSVHEETRLVILVKGKRTKRQRSASPMNTEAVSGEERSQEAREEGAGEDQLQGTTDEDQDMANCLMLLSQGHKAKDSGNHFSTQKYDFLSGKKPVASLGSGLEGAYQCKTCDKSFGSFQALGGHRTSHKRPKLGATLFKCDENKSSPAVETVEAVGSFLSLQVTSSDGNKKQEKAHECSICKAEFSSGQALGGHMRRHRGLTLNATIKRAISSSSHRQESIRESNFLELDLNLPAPEDETKFVFTSKDQILLFTAASNSLIDCHH